MVPALSLNRMMMRAARKLGLIFGVLTASAWLATAGCEPLTSNESIFRDVDREPDPAIKTPYLERNVPGREEVTSRPADPFAKPAPLIPPPPTATAARLENLPAEQPAVRAWIDGHQGQTVVGSRTLRVLPPVSTTPTVRFELEARLGEFRSAAIQVYKVIDNRVDLATGLRIKEDGDNAALVPKRDIYLAKPGGRTAIRHIVGGATLDELSLQPGQEYEVQFLIGGTKTADALALRIITAIPPTSQPADGPTTRPTGPALPPGVIVH